MAKGLYPKLHARVIEKLGTYEELAKLLGMSRQNLSNKVCDKTPFTVKDIKAICKILAIPKKELHEYFFVD